MLASGAYALIMYSALSESVMWQMALPLLMIAGLAFCQGALSVVVTTLCGLVFAIIPVSNAHTRRRVIYAATFNLSPWPIGAQYSAP